MTAPERTAALPPALPPAPASAPQLTDRGAVVLAVAVWVSAVAHRPVPALVLVGVVLGVLVVRRPVVLVVAAALLAGTLASRAHGGLHPVAPGPYSGVATLVADPSPTAFGWRADVRLGHRRVELTAGDAAGGALSAALTGERIRVEGKLAPPRPSSPWLVPRHVVGRLAATSVERVDAGAAPWRAANRFRRLLQRGASTMGERERSLYAGFVLGDDRDQPPEVVDDFRGAGLTHLLVVSGQNVAFLLVLVSPITTRLRWGGRWAVTIAVIAVFGVVTRFEPSVLRASAMAAVAVTAGAVGRPTGSVRTLALAVSGLILVDPLLVHSTGFQLSVGASLAIAVGASRIARVLPGPGPLADAVGVTLAAQFGVAPVLVPLAGGLPVVSLLANPLAVPVAGLVTTWGLPAGVVAGLGGHRLASVVHLPTELMIRWVAAVARVGASVPLGALGWPHLAGLAVALAVAARPPPLRIAAVPVALVSVLAPAVALRSPPTEVVADGLSVHRAGGATVVVVDGAPPVDALEVLRTAGVRRIDVLVVDGRGAAELVRVLRHRWSLRRVIDAGSSGPVRLLVGGLDISVEPPAPPVVTARPP
ncbi:MAG TPA: ComEC/Rec2 family competence protein [Acidimicrobiales bacterium]|nr:ComEC/Rec2 family competence protein [Acidimicrobiales bacterium]